MAETGEVENDEELNYYVFCCTGCSSIFGDSFAAVEMNHKLNTISLNVTGSVEETDSYKTSRDEEDKGSTYCILVCKFCHDPIGRIYTATPRKLDHIRDHYTLDLNRIKSYQLGDNSNKKIIPKIKDTQLMMQSMIIHLNKRVSKLESYVEEIVEPPENETLKEGMEELFEIPENGKKRKLV